MRKIEATALVLAVAASACGERAPADRPDGDTSGASAAATPQVTDGNIVAFLINTHQAEVSLATTAQASASSETVKDFAARMAREHGAMKRAIDSLAAAKGITAEAPPGMETLQAMIAGRADTLLNTTGRSTDIAYVDGEAKAHGQTIEALVRYADAAKDEDLRALIRRSIPAMRLHQDRAIDILRGL